MLGRRRRPWSSSSRQVGSAAVGSGALLKRYPTLALERRIFIMSSKSPKSPLLLFALALGLSGLLPSVSVAHKKERFAETGRLVEMQDVPCGTRQKGLAGVGNIFASVGVTDVNAKDKLCQEYILRTADEEYRIRPVDEKHAGLLPVGAESEFRIKKDRILLSVPEGDGKVR